MSVLLLVEHDGKSIRDATLAAVTETMGPIYDRTQERLGSTDAMIIRTRRRLISAATALRDGCLIPEASNSSRTSAVIGQITFASVFSLATSSATEPTFTPALRFGGSATFSVVRRGAGSTPRSAGLMLSIGFLRAFMIFGSEA